ncbi:SDR family NAD(P)-dependent oxidoreductase [Nocardia goodfellowii]|uniref:NAD(P)-dependent dehydrogenase (Short-subunit alcohol dehydrogenase family) n=1 Tax=Nocardia goodfellowii TaxID=882446 RepID=A0ABS4QIV3_9NOCA|nr:SDR family NAD(P)-dependent oxidoreductase [Nocardia goodfellowii]MBP2191590.1 NAD(P)-dependent dehydrogenase (short-subunit alcohol dehydrogenase family) [Nocardia goodfellowii]
MITDGGGDIAQRLAGFLIRHGVRAEVVDDVPAGARAVVFLGGLRDIDSPLDAIAINREAFSAAKAFAASDDAAAGLFVTVQDTGADFGRSGRQGVRAWSGGLAGLARTVAREWPEVAVKAIDCERGDRTAEELAEVLGRELLLGGAALDVGLHANGIRTTLTTQPAPPLPAADRSRLGIGTESVLVVTGGGRGITAECCLALARLARPRLVLLGRSPLTPEPELATTAHDQPALVQAILNEARRRGEPAPGPATARAHARSILAGRELRRTLAALAEAGAPTQYLSLDVRDSAALDSALAAVRARWGKITGIVHGAGVVVDKVIADKSTEDFGAVFDTKVVGLRALLAATADDPIDLMCVFGSVAGQYGNAGQSDYAMANEVLSQVVAVEKARRPGLRAHAVCWGPWAGGMVGADLAAHMRARGVVLIPPAAGASALLTEIAQGGSDERVVICAGDDFGRLTTQPARKLVWQVVLSSRTHPELWDHQIEGTPIVPVVSALEWFTAVGADRFPDRDQLTLRNLQVLRTLALPDFAEHTQDLRITMCPGEQPDSPAAVEVAGMDGRPRYRAILEARTSGAVPRWRTPDFTGSGPTPLYDGELLFHGPRFQSLCAVEGIGPQGAAAAVTRATALGWSDEQRSIDPAALDGALQLAVLWAADTVGFATLPMSVDRVHVYRQGQPQVPARCIVRAGAIGRDHATCDAALVDSSGSAYVELLGISLIRRPERTNPARFQR